MSENKTAFLTSNDGSRDTLKSERMACGSLSGLRKSK